MEDIDPERGEMRGWFGYWGVLTAAHHRLGQHREELEAARRARALIPERPAFLYWEVDALAGLGRIGDIETLLRDHLEDVPTPSLLLRHAGRELLAHGSRSEGEVFLRRSLEWDLERPSDEPAYRFRLSYSHYLLGEWDEAQRFLHQLATEYPDNIAVQGRLGTLAAHTGDTAEARRISQWMADLDRPWMFGNNTYWRAAIASLLGDPEEAVRLLQQTWREGGVELQVFHLVHLDPDFDPIRDHPAFQEFVRPKG